MIFLLCPLAVNSLVNLQYFLQIPPHPLVSRCRDGNRDSGNQLGFKAPDCDEIERVYQCFYEDIAEK